MFIITFMLLFCIKTQIGFLLTICLTWHLNGKENASKNKQGGYPLLVRMVLIDSAGKSSKPVDCGVEEFI